MKFRVRPHFWSLAIVSSTACTLASLLNAAEIVQPRAPEAPQVAEASSDAQDQIGTFRKPADLECAVFAAEPDVANPVVFAVDNQGRVFTCESFRQSDGVTDNRSHDDEWLKADLATLTVADRIEYHQRLLGSQAADYVKKDDRIRMLVDKDQDGKADEVVVFADRFNNLEDGSGAGVLVRGNTAYYTNIPHLWKLVDEDGDGVADQRTSLAYGFGVRVAFRGHDMHGLIIGPDGRLYFSIGDRGYHVQTHNGTLSNPESGAVFRCELDGSNLEVVATGLRNPQELAFDNYGNLFTGDNNSDSGDKARWVYVVAGGDTGWRMNYQYFPDRGPFNREKIWYPYSEETPAYTVPPIANFSDGPSGLTFDPGTGLTEEFRNAFLLVDFRGQASNSGIRLIRNEADGAFFKIKEDSQPIWNILATDADFAPDGSLYVSDWVNGWTGEGKGRIYRFFNEEQVASDLAKEVKRILASDFSQYPNNDLLDLLSHQDRRIRNEAQWQLAEKSATAELLGKAQSSDADQFSRLHSVWGLWQIARKNGYSTDIKTALLQLVQGDDAELAVAAINAIADSRDVSIGPTINEAIGSAQPRVAAAAAMAAGRLRLADSIDVACLMLAANDNKDPILRHAGIMALTGQSDMNRVVALREHESQAVRLAAVVALRKREDSRVIYFLNDNDEAVVLEAARAIHDTEILRRHLPKIATLDLKPDASPALARRVLNANYRMGGEDAANRIASIAANNEQATETRLEALEMLGKWGSPGKTDWVMNRFDPLPDRDASPAIKALEANLESLIASNDNVVRASLRIASEYGLESVQELFKKMVADTNIDSSQRVIALQGLMRASAADADQILNAAMTDADPGLRSVALELFAERSPDKALPALQKAVQSESVLEQQTAWDLIGKIRNGNTETILANGLKGYLDDTIAKEVRLNVFEAARRSRSDAIRQIYKQIEDAREGLDTSNPVVYYADSELGGDPAKGQKLFFERTQLSCVRCHKISDKGGEVGPNLTKIGTERATDYLLESIVAPNAKIPDNFKTVIVQTEDGKIISGVVRADTDEYLELMNAEGKIERVEQDNIIGQKEGLSSMPADLMKSMNARELRDLVAFLKTLDGTVDVGGFVEGHAEE